MNLDRFTLAATTNNLTREKHVREWADVVEFRMDSAEDPITQLSEYDGELPIIATNRGQWFGGEAHDTGRLDTLFEAAKFDAVQMVDIELETARGTSWVLEAFQKEDVGLIISFHEFDSTPDLPTLKAIFEDCARYGDIAKVATYANDHTDALNMIQAVNDATKNGLRVAGISMGEIGRHTRAVAPLYGSKLGYAPLKSDKSEYAPGQIPIDELAFLIKALRVNDEGMMQALGRNRESVMSREAVKLN